MLPNQRRDNIEGGVGVLVGVGDGAGCVTTATATIVEVFSVCSVSAEIVALPLKLAIISSIWF